MQDTLSERTARAAQQRNHERNWHLQRSPPAQSEDLPPEVWLPSLSDDERLVKEHAQSRAPQRASTPLCLPGVVSESLAHR